MSKVLVAYFSVGGTTAKAAKALASAEGADLFAIRPETPYIPADLDYTNKQSRTTLEMTDPSCRPATVGKVDNMAQYDVIFVGFPIWWGREPSIVDTFLEAYSFAGKKLVPFCTSGGNDTTAARGLAALPGDDSATAATIAAVAASRRAAASESRMAFAPGFLTNAPSFAARIMRALWRRHAKVPLGTESMRAASRTGMSRK